MISKSFMGKVLSRLDKVDTEQLKFFIKKVIEDMELLYKMWDDSSASIIIFTSKQEVEYINTQALKILRYDPTKPDALVGKNVNDIFKTADFKKNLIQKMQLGERMEDEEHILGKPLVRVIRASFYPIRDNTNAIRMYLLLFLDVTRKKLEDIKSKRDENIQSMIHLAAGLAHEIKNPLASVDIHLKLLDRYLKKAPKFNEKKEMGSFLKILQEEVDRLNDIVGDFLSSIRPISLDLGKVNLEKLIKDLATFLALELQENNVNIELILEDYLPPVLGDEKYLKVVFLNLLKNAIEAFPKKQKKRLISLKIYENSPYVITVITDNGMGIPAEKVQKVFEPYFTTKNEGTGIGLTMVHKIITEHHGNIKVESIENEGTTFTVLIPQYKGETAKVLEDKRKIKK